MHKRVFLSLLLTISCVIFLSSCARQPTDFAYNSPGFFLGLLHGIIAPFAFLFSLFTETRIYAFPNSGRFYDFGFLLGFVFINYDFSDGFCKDLIIRVFLSLSLFISCVILSSYATHPTAVAYNPLGFFHGLLHGIFCLQAFLVSLFMDIRIYAFPNSGRFYDFGFLIGIALPLGGFHCFHNLLLRVTNMSYVENNLMPNEAVIYKAHLHWFIFLESIITGIIGLAICWFSQVFFHEIRIILILGLLVLLFSGFSLFNACIEMFSTELVVTSKRVVAKKGFILRKTFELNHNKIEGCSIDQGIIGRIFNYGLVVVNGIGGGHQGIPNIANPLEFRIKVMEAIG